MDWIVRPEIGIQGNPHMIMMDTNPDAVAAVIHEWRGKNDLLRYRAGRSPFILFDNLIFNAAGGAHHHHPSRAPFR